MTRRSLALVPVLSATALLAAGCEMSMATPPGVAQTPPGSTGDWVIDFVDGTSLSDAQALTGDDDLTWFHPLAADDGLALLDAPSAAQVARLGEHPAVEAIEPSGMVEAYGFPDDPMYDRQWNFSTVGAESGWRLSDGGGVTVAVIDTGVSQVPDLAGTALLEGVSFVRGEPTAADGNGHGTHVAGTIAQTTNNGVGVAGLAPGATILPLKALSASGSGRTEWVAAAIDEAGDQGAQIINLSLGGPPSAVIANAVEKAQARGILVVAAAGNTGRKGVGSPASLPGVVAVSATGPTDARAPYSSWGPEVVLSAPGGDKTKKGGGILQDTVSRGSKDGHAFQEFQGTSMATPHVAGAAAVIWSATGGGAEHVKSVLTDASVDLGDPGRDPVFGHGRLDLDRAVKQVALHERGLAFGLMAFLGWVLAARFGPRRAGFKLATALTAGLTAGGVFFLPLLGGAPNAVVQLVSRPLLLWADPVLGASWARHPVLMSALLPLLLTFLLGPSRRLGPIAAGVTVGVGGHLLYGAATGSLSPSWFTGGFGTAWLAANGVLAVLAAVAALGVQRMQDRDDA